MVLVYDQIALGNFAQAVQRVLAALFLFLHAAHAKGAGGDHGISGKRQAAPGTQLPGQHLHQPGGGRGGSIGGDLQAVGAQVVGKTGCRAGSTCHHSHGGTATAQRVHILQQGGDLAAPRGQGVRGRIDHDFQGNIRHTAHKIFGADGGVPPRLRPQPRGVGEQITQPGSQHTVLQQGGKLLAPAEIRRTLGFLYGGRLLKNQQRLVQIVQHGGGFGIAHGEIFVHIHRHHPGVQLAKLGGKAAFQRGALFAALLFQKSAQQLGGSGRCAQQDLPRRADVYFGNALVPALGGKVKGVQGVDLIAPKLHTHGLFHIGGIDIHNIAAHRKLPRSVHLGAAGVPGAVQKRGQFLARQGVPGVQRAGVGAKIRARGGVLGQRFLRHADGAQPPAHKVAQNAQAAVFVLAPGAFDGAQQIIPRGEHRCRDAQHVQIARKTGRFRFAGGHDAQGCARVPRQRRVHHGTPGAGYAK